MKKFLSIFACFVMILVGGFSLAACGCSENRDDQPSVEPSQPENPETPEEPEETEFVYEISDDGLYVYFGSYAQTIKSDAVTVSENADDDGYYTGSDGEKYMKVTMDVESKLSSSTYESYTTYKMNVASDGTEMQDGQDYYFKVEKLKWRVLSTVDGDSATTYTLMCDNAIQAMAFHTESTFKDEDGNAMQRAYYEYSTLRTYLNNDFYDKTFSAEQKAIIVSTTYTNAHNSAEMQDDVYLRGVFATTDDVKASTPETNPTWATTDYARATGAWTYTTEYLTAKDMNENIQNSAKMWDGTSNSMAAMFGNYYIVIYNPAMSGSALTTTVSDASVCIVPSVQISIAK